MVDRLCNSSAPQFRLVRSKRPIYFEEASQAVKSMLRDENGKIDFETEDGQNRAKRCLRVIEKLCQILQVKTADRSYRREFTPAYQVLYKPRRLCYLLEIIDSAQEGNPHLWVNSEKYEFSNEVLDAGQVLFRAFEDLLIKMQTKQGDGIRAALQTFDENWANYEYMYIDMHLHSQMTCSTVRKIKIVCHASLLILQL